MSILEQYQNAIESKDRKKMNEYIHVNFSFINYSQGKTLSKEDIISWAMSGDVNRKKIRILYENSEIGVEHSFASFNDGKKQAVLAFYTFKDGKVFSAETGATNIKD